MPTVTGQSELSQVNLTTLNADEALTKLDDIGKKYSGRLRNDGTFGKNAASQRQDLRQTMHEFRDKICGNDQQLIDVWNNTKTWGKYKRHDLTGPELQNLVGAMKAAIRRQHEDPNKQTNDRAEIQKNQELAKRFANRDGRFVTQFHATKKKFLQQNDQSNGILNDGLDPNFGGKGAAQLDPTKFEKLCQNKVHLTRQEYHAQEYQTMYETGSHPGIRDKTYPNPEPAEVLKVSVSKQQYERSEIDPDDRYARTFSEKIEPNQIRVTSPTSLPDDRDDDKMQEYQNTYQSHQHKGNVENETVYSWLNEEQSS